MSKFVGIDLGTSNSAIACKTLDTEVLPNSEGDLLTPSCVYFDPQADDPSADSATCVGKAAFNWRKQAPHNVILGVKRLMGRSIDDKQVQKMIATSRFGYQIEALALGTRSSLSIAIEHKQDKRQLSPEDISAIILKKLVNDGEHHLKDTIDTAVITVPAYFNDKQKHATRIAAGKANLKLACLLPESTAAAISFGMKELDGEGTSTVMVYDFGGGTLDISILTIGGKNIIEHGKTGDMWLGGNDIDEAMVSLILEHANKTLDTPVQTLIESKPPMEQKRIGLDLLAQAERAKIELSRHNTVYIDFSDIFEDDELVDIEVTITRNEFEEKIASHIERGIHLAQRLLEEIDFSVDLIDQVLLVGGTSQIPLVQARLVALFGEEKVKLHHRPTLAIVEGAALLAHRINGDDAESVQQFGEIAYTAAHDYYLELAGGLQHLIVAKHSPLPIEAKLDVKLASHDQILARFKFSNQVNDNFEPIGDLWISVDSDEDDRQDGKNATPKSLTLMFHIDVDNLIHVSVLEHKPHQRALTKTLSRGKIDEKLMQHLETAITKIKQANDNYYLTRDYEERASHIVANINQVLDVETETINQPILEQTEAMLKLGDAVIDNNEHFYPNIWYVQRMIDSYGYLEPKLEVKKVQDKLRTLKKINLDGEYEQVLALRDESLDISDEVFKKHEGHDYIMKAIATGIENNLEKETNDIKDCLQNGDEASIKRAFSIADSILQSKKSQSRNICTDVTI